MGEPGLGKSRLFYEFKLLSQAGGLVLEAPSVSHGKVSPYLPVIELLKSYFDIQAQDDERKRREKVAGKVLMLDRTLEDTLPYLFALLGIEEQLSPLQQMNPQIRRRRTFEALKKLLLPRGCVPGALATRTDTECAAPPEAERETAPLLIPAQCQKFLRPVLSFRNAKYMIFINTFPHNPCCY